MGNLPECLDVVGTVGSSGEIGQVELDLVPALIKPHGHGADEGLNTRGGLVVGGAESSAHILVVQDLHLKREVFLQLFPAENTPWSANHTLSRAAKWPSFGDVRRQTQRHLRS